MPDAFSCTSGLDSMGSEGMCGRTYVCEKDIQRRVSVPMYYMNRWRRAVGSVGVKMVCDHYL